MKLSLKEIVEITGGTLLSGNPEDEILDLCIDSRVAKKGDLFVPLLGANADGHQYLTSALQGASAALCSKEGIEVPKDKGLILVKDTEKEKNERRCPCFCSCCRRGKCTAKSEVLI